MSTSVCFTRSGAANCSKTPSRCATMSPVATTTTARILALRKARFGIKNGFHRTDRPRSDATPVTTVALLSQSATGEPAVVLAALDRHDTVDDHGLDADRERMRCVEGRGIA